MNKMPSMIKYLINTFLVMGIAIILSASANAAYLSINAGAENNELGLTGGIVYNEQGVGDGHELANGSVLQYIYAGVDGVNNLPDTNGNQTGDDVLLATKYVGSDTVYAVFSGKVGQFYHNVTGTYTSSSPKVYVRAWNATSLSSATYYGDSALLTPATGSNPPSANEVGISNFATTTLKPNPATLVSIAVTPTDPSIALGYAKQFAATGTYSDNSTKNITSSVNWVSATPTTATINGNGLATSVAQGTTNITAALSDKTSPAQTLTVTVPILVSITVTPANQSITLGQTKQFTAIGTYSDNSTQEITSSVIWASNDTNKATIDNTGLATSVAQGTTNITASLSAIASPVQTLTVTSAPQPSAVVTPAKLVVEAGETIVVTLQYSEENKTTFNWQAPKTLGTYDVTTNISNVTLSGVTSVTVVPAALDYVVITPATVTLSQGESKTFTAKGYDVYGNERSDTFSFASDKLGNSGTVQANVSAGEYLLSAYKDGKSATATITVVSKYEEIIAKVENGQVKLSAKDSLGNEVALAEGAVVAYEVTGKADGNQVKADGTFIPGTKEGDYTITAAVTVGGQTLTANTAVSVDLGGPVMQIKVDDQDMSNDLAISSKPKITVALTDGNGVKAVRIEIDGKEVNGLSVHALGSNGTTSYSPSVALSSGAHTLLVEAEDSLGTKRTVTAQGLKVYDVLMVTGKPMNYPNPCQPSSGVGTTINYKLTQNTAIKLMIYDLTGRLVHSQNFAAGENGGKLENDVTWDGRSLQGAYVPNGVYAYFITANGKALGSGEIAVYE